MLGASGRVASRPRRMQMHDCAGRDVRDLIAWRGDVETKLKGILKYVTRIGSDATTLRIQVQGAISAMCQRHPVGARYLALRDTVGGALAWWDGRCEELDKKHNTTLTTMVAEVQNMFIERMREWTTFMAPWGWRRQTRWAHRDWVRLIFGVLRHYTVGRRRTRYARRRAIRKIGTVLIRLMRDGGSRRVGEARREERVRRRREARRRLRNILWGIYIRGAERARLRDMPFKDDTVGGVERWVDAVHFEGGSGEARAMGAGLEERLVHAMRCLAVYVRVVVKRMQREHEHNEECKERKRKALWNICALLVREYKQRIQDNLLNTRKETRCGLVCAHTRNVGRLGPMKGVRYDETRRNRPSIKVGDVYKLKRWPRRDKDGPTMVRMLHYLWGIT